MYINYVIYPVKVEEWDKDNQICQAYTEEEFEGQPDFWTVYGVTKDNFIEAIADFRDKEHAQIFLEKMNPNSIEISWNIEDVKLVAEQEDKEITDEECRGILERLKHNHDAEFGITWEHIRQEL